MSEEFDEKLYEYLGIDASATGEEVKKAWRKRAREFHEDIVGDGSRNEDFSNAKLAAKVLGDPKSRAAYDEWLAQRRVARNSADEDDLEPEFSPPSPQTVPPQRTVSQPPPASPYNPPTAPSAPGGGSSASSSVTDYEALLGCIIMLFVVAAIVTGGYLLWPRHHTPQAGSSSTQTSTDANTSVTSALPQQADASFDVTPTLEETSVSGSMVDAAGNAIDVTLDPSLSGFELTLQVTATSSELQSKFLADDFANSAMGVTSPEPYGPSGQYEEPPLSVQLSDSGSSVTGALTFAAVLPGTYVFAFSEVNGGSITVGTVNAHSMGVSDGMTVDNALVIFDERRSLTDTVIVYGAVGGPNDSLAAQISASSCIIDYKGQSAQLYRSSAQSVAERQSGNGQWFEVGTMTFDLPATEFNRGDSGISPDIAYRCMPNESPGDAVQLANRIKL